MFLYFSSLYQCIHMHGLFFSVQILITMAVWTLHGGIFILMTVVTTVRSQKHIAPQAVYQKLEHALITDSKVGYLMQHTFFPSHVPSRDRIFISVNVTVGSMMPGSCDGSPLLDDAPTSFSFYQEFQWSKSPLLNLISVVSCYKSTHSPQHGAP